MDILPYWPNNNADGQNEHRLSRRRFIKGAGAAVGAAALFSAQFIINSLIANRETPQHEDFFYGVTLDSIDNLGTTSEVLRELPERPTTRIVFDEYIKPGQYTQAVNHLGNVSDIMGEILDSYYVKEYSQKEYEARTREYVDAFLGQIAIWEVGNEINGEWLKKPGEPRSAVAEKVTAAHDIVKDRGGKTAITLYYNQDCWADPSHEMFRWVDEVLSERVKNEVDYVFVGYYEEDCNNLRPDWQDVFERVSEAFPNSKLGFGEVGKRGSVEQKAAYLERYYNIRPDVDNFVGGYFWWYFKQDMVDAYADGDTRMVDALSNTMR